MVVRLSSMPVPKQLLAVPTGNAPASFVTMGGACNPTVYSGRRVHLRRVPLKGSAMVSCMRVALIFASRHAVDHVRRMHCATRNLGLHDVRPFRGTQVYVVDVKSNRYLFFVDGNWRSLRFSFVLRIRSPQSIERIILANQRPTYSGCTRPIAAHRSPRKADIPGGSTQRPGRYNRKRLQPIQRAGDIPCYL